MYNVISCGAINWDINLFVSHLPKEGEEVRVLRIERVPGGTAANVIVAAARYLGPGKTAIIGAVGDDEIGRKQIEILKKEGVSTEYVLIINGVESGQAYILIDKDGANVINTFFGANTYLSTKYIASISKVFRESKVKVVMDPPLDVAIKILELGYGFGINIWDPGVYIEYGIKALAKGLRYTDILILNHIEVKELFGTLQLTSLVNRLRELECSKLLIKYGSKGSQLINIDENTIVNMSTLPLDKISLKVVNTVGCGDAFIGVFGAALSEDKSLIDAMLLATIAAGYKASRRETRGSPSRDVLIGLHNRCKEYINIQIKNI